MVAGLATALEVIATYRPGVQAINRLESRIATAPDDMDAMRWTQAALVMQQLETMTQKELAAQWINLRTGRPYEARYVYRIVRVFKTYSWQCPRPRFAQAYRIVKYRQQHNKRTARVFTVTPPPVVTPPVVLPKLARASVKERRNRCREMAAEGATIHQIAAAIGISTSTVSKYIKAEGYELTARRAGATHRHNANRIVEQMAMDAENLTADVNLIAFGELDPARLPAWIAAFTESQARLREFILKLKGAAQ